MIKTRNPNDENRRDETVFRDTDFQDRVEGVVISKPRIDQFLQVLSRVGLSKNIFKLHKRGA